MATNQNSPRQGNRLKDGDYEVTLGSHKLAMKLITRRNHEPTKSGVDQSRILMVRSSTDWFNKTGNRWSGFAFYNAHHNKLHVWAKFMGSKKRGCNWDLLAQAFRDQVMTDAYKNAHQRLMDGALDAMDMFDEDELESYAAEMQRQLEAKDE